MLSYLSRINVASVGGLLMLASCTVLNPTFAGEDSSTGAETSDSSVTQSSSSGEGSESSVSDSISSTTLSSSTGGGGTTGSSDSSGGGDSVSFIEPTGGCGTLLPDGVLAHCSVDCDVLEQDCPEGEACRAWANDGGSVWNATRCSPVSENPDQHGDPCTVEGSATSGADTCDVGLMCWNVDSETLEGECISYCTGTPETPICEDPDRTCSITNDGVLALCFAVCDPLLGNCDGDNICIPGVNDQFVCAPEEASSCPAGMLDVPAKDVAGCIEDEPCCTPYCDLSDATPCEPQMECVPFYIDPAPAYMNLGVCITAL